MERSLMTLVEAKASYFAAARQSSESPAVVRYALSQTAAHLAAQVAQADSTLLLRDIDVARAMRTIARQCYCTASDENWTNCHSLDVADEVFAVVLIWFSCRRAPVVPL